jgi:hypothetical protein
MKNRKTVHRHHVIGAAIAALLTACGGGGGTDSTGPTSTTLTLSGTAATGLAISGATVQAKCASGIGTATTQADGRYSITVDGGALPCVLEVAPAGGEPLHSVIDGSGGGSATVNITPLTELVAANAAGGSPAALFANFDAAAQAKLSANNVQAAVGAVITALQGVVDLTGVNPIKDTLVAATGAGATGNALDQKLDTLKTALDAAQTTLAELTAAVAANSGGSAAPLQTLLQPTASGCVGFRSGRYMALNPGESDPAWAVHPITVDAATLNVSMTVNGQTDSTQLTDNGGCVYTTPDNGESTSKILVSKSGLTIGRTTYSSGVYTGLTDVTVVVPLQDIPASELAGEWNAVDYFRETGTATFVPGHARLTVDAGGKVTAFTTCDSANVCSQQPVGSPTDAFTVNPAGGFDVGGDATEPASRAFAFKTAEGKLSLFVLYSNQRGMIVATKQASQTLPAVGFVSNIWDFSIASNGFASPLIEMSTTVTGVDTVTNSYTRIRASDGRIDGFKLDDPWTGLRSRAASSCTVNGAVNNCSGILVLPLPGTGVSVYTAVAPANFFGISVSRP